MLLENRVAIVSGIGPGLGRAVALALAREGADIALAARTVEVLEEVAEEVRGLGRRALCVPTDISEPSQCKRLVETTTSDLGRVDVLVNNAFRSSPYTTVADSKREDWQKIFGVNLFGTLELSKACLPVMREQGSGSIVMIGSMSMRVIEPLFGAYAASKAALLSATQTLAKEIGGDGIRVNSVVPGYIWGPALRGFFASLAEERGCTAEDLYEEVAARTALGKIPTPEEIAEPVVFFASDLAAAVTGQSLDVNAGHFFQ